MMAEMTGTRREVGFNRLCREGVKLMGGWFGFE